MADPAPTSDQTNPDQTNPQQALDDLTVLSNVQTQSLGDARLNVMRAIDGGEAGFGALANIHEGATLTAPTLQTGAIQTGIAIGVETSIASSTTIALPDALPTTTGATIEVTSAPATVVAAPIFTAAAATTVAGTAPAAAPPPPVFAAGPAGLEAPTGHVQAAAPTAAPAVAPAFTLPPLPTITVNEISPTSTTITHGATAGENGTIDFLPSAGGLSPTVSGPLHGSVVFDATTGEYVYAPATDFVGTDTFVVSVTDGYGRTVADTVTVDVNGPVVNGITDTAVHENADASAAATGQVSVSEVVDGATVASPTLGYTVPDSGSGAPAHGTVSFAADGTYTYTPAHDFVGTDSFTVTVSDGQGGSITKTIAIDVNGPEVTGIVTPTGHENSALTGQVGAAEVVDGQATSAALTFTVPTGGEPAHGTVSFAADGTYTFTPNADFIGADSFTVTVSDGQGGTITKTITIDVDGPEVTGNAGVTAFAGHQVQGTITAVEAGPTADSGATLSYSLATGADAAPAHGSVTVNADGSYTYTANAGDATGSDSFKVVVSDGEGGHVTQTVSVSDLANPTTTTEANAADVRGAAATAAFTASDAAGDSMATTATAGHGTVVVNADGTYTYTETDKGFTGTDTVTFTTDDGHGGTTVTTATVTVGDGATITPSAAPVSDYAGHSVTGAVTASDQFGDSMSYALADGTGAAPTHGSVTVNPDGSYTYTASAGYAGSDSFQVQVSDGHGGMTTQTVSVTDLANPTTTTEANAADVRGATATAAFTASDAAGDSMATTATAGHGTVVVNADGTYTYTETDKGFTGTDTVTFTTDDGHGGTTVTTATVTVGDGATITPNAAPATDYAGHSVTGSVTASDQFGDSMSYALADGTGAAPTHGSVVVNADGTYTYSATAGDATGSDSFQVVVSDGHGGSVTQTVTVNDLANPTTVTEAPATDGRGGSATATFTASDAAHDTMATTATAEHGTVVVNADGTYTYTETGTGFTGTDTVTFTTDDGHGGTTVTTATVTVADNATITPSATPVSDYAGHSATGAVTATDQFGDSMSYALADGTGAAPTHGSVTVNPDGSYTYTASAGYAGTDSFQVQVSDGHGGTVTQTVNVSDLANPTTVTEAPATDGRGGSATATFTASDAAHDTMATTATAEHGTVVVNADGTYTYTETGTGFTGTDTVTFTTDDGHGGTTVTTATVTVADNATITPSATPVSDYAGHSATGAVTASDQFGDSMSYALADGTGAAPTHGSVTVNPDGSYTYTAAPNYSGADSFKVAVSDGHGGTVTQTVSVTDQDPLHVTSTAATSDYAGHTVTGGLGATDTAGDSLSYSLVDNSGGTAAAHGTVTVGTDGGYTYTADAGYAGTDSFQVAVTDAHGNIATQTVTVTDLNDTPTVAASLGTPTVSESGSFTATNDGGSAGFNNTYGYYIKGPDGVPETGTILFANMNSQVGSSVTITGVDPNSVGFFVIPNGDQNAGVTSGEQIHFAQDGNGNWEALNSSNQVLVGSGGANVLFDNAALNTDHLAHVEDNSGNAGNQDWEDLTQGSDRDFNDVNTSVHWNAATATASVPLTISAAFPDMTGDETHSVTVTLPQGTTLMENGVALTPTTTGGSTYTLAPSQLTDLTVAVPNGYDGSLTVTVTATAQDGSSVATATAATQSLSLDLADAGPSTAATQTLSGHEVALSGSVVASDSQGDALSYSLATNANGAAIGLQHGSVVLNTDGTFTYTPNSGFVGSDSFQVVVSDQHGGTTTQTVIVNETNAAPVDTAGAATTVRLGAATGTFTATDADGDSLTTTATAGHGTVVVHADGTYTYTETDRGFTGSDTVTFTTSDGHGGTTTATAVVTVGDGASITTGTSGTPSDYAGHSVTGTVTASDQFGDSMSYSLAGGSGAAPAHGTVTVNADGTYTYTATAGDATGSDSFQVQVSDGHGGVTTQTVHITDLANPTTVTTANATDLAGATATATFTASDAAGDSMATTATAGHGTVVVNANGTYTYTETSPNFAGTDTVTFTTSDGHGDTTVTTATVTVSDGAPTLTTVGAGPATETLATATVGTDQTSTRTSTGDDGGDHDGGDHDGGGGCSDDGHDNDGGDTVTTIHTQTIHVDLINNTSEIGGLQVSGFHAGDVVTDGSESWTANAAGTITISQSQYDGMVFGGAESQDFTVTSTQGAVGSVGVAVETAGGGGGTFGVYVQQLSIAASSPDAAGGTMSYSVTGLPAGASLVDANGDALSASTLTDAQVQAGVYLTTPNDIAAGAFTLAVTASLTETNGTVLTSPATTLTIDAAPYQAGAQVDFANHVTGQWGGGWYALDVGADGVSGTGQEVSIAGFNQNTTEIVGNYNDTLIGSSGDDYVGLVNGSGQQMIAGFGHFQLGNGATEILDLTANVDYGVQNVTIAAGTGNDIVWGPDGTTEFIAGTGTDTFHGGAGADTIMGSDGNLSVLVHDANNTIVAGSGADSITAGNGDNFITLGGGTDGVTVGGGDNLITLGGGNDNLTAGDGNNLITAGNGNNVITVGNGNDDISVGSGTNVITLGDGTDTVTISGGHDTILAGGGSDVITVGASTILTIDHVDSSAASSSIVINTDGHSGSSDLMFDFSAGHDTVTSVTGGSGTSWTDTLDLSQHAANILTISVTDAHGTHSWTEAANAHGTIDFTASTHNGGLNEHNLTGTATVTEDGHTHTIDFSNIEKITY